MPFDLGKLNDLINEEFGFLFPAQPRMGYYKAKRGRKVFGYNIEPLTPRPEHKMMKWAACIYRVSGNKYTLIKEAYFRQRKTAKARALRWYWANEKTKQKQKLKAVPSQQVQ